jgi:RNA polymerase sigma-70 factor (ECF subfamily)
MDEHHPKRRKDKHNPYTIKDQNGRYLLSFQDSQGVAHELQIPKALYDLFNDFELRDLSYLNEVDRHIEQSELTEAALYQRAFSAPQSTEELAFASIENEILHRTITELPKVQRRRLVLYYFCGLTYEQIAAQEGCTKMPIKRSIDRAEEKIRQELKNFEK